MVTQMDLARADDILARQRGIEHARAEVLRQIQALWAEDERLSTEWVRLLDEWMGIMGHGSQLASPGTAVRRPKPKRKGKRS